MNCKILNTWAGKEKGTLSFNSLLKYYLEDYKWEMKLKGSWTYIFHHPGEAFSVVTASPLVSYLKICEVHRGIQSELLSSKKLEMHF